MRIVISEPKNQFATVLYQAGKTRFATMTDVKYIGPNRIVAAHRYACKLYLIQIDDFSENKYTILYTLSLTHMGKPVQTEMMGIYHNTIYLICFNEMMFVIDIEPNDTLTIRKMVCLGKPGAPAHGICIHGEYAYITPSAKNYGYDNIIEYHIPTETILYLPSLGPTLRIKHIAFTRNEYAIIVVVFKTNTGMTNRNHAYNGAIQLYAPNMKCVQTIKYPLTHFDAVCISDTDPEVFYATGADDKGSYIYKGIIQNNTIISVQKIPCVDFPHGIDIYGDKIVYSTFGESSIEWMDI
jgi:hypothetical protein